jgi:Uma2 family endonuclease
MTPASPELRSPAPRTDAAPHASGADRPSGAPLDDRATPTGLPSQKGDWTWEMATLYPRQGEWTEREYLAREFDGLVEYADGTLEFLAMPTLGHQWIVAFLHAALAGHVVPRRLGITAFAPVRVRVRDGTYREPDVVFATRSRIVDASRPLAGADLVMEVVSESPEDRVRDLHDKRTEYAAAGIPEYWIVDPETRTVTVLTLPDGATEYRVHGEFRPGQTADSVLLPGFAIDVAACFAAGELPAS